MKTICALCDKPASDPVGYTVYTLYAGCRVHQEPGRLVRTTNYTDPQVHHYSVCRSCKTKWGVIVPLARWIAATTLILIGFGVGILGAAVIRPEWEFLWAGPGCLVPLIVLVVAIVWHRQSTIETTLIRMAVSLRAEQGRKAGKAVDRQDNKGVYRSYAGFNPRKYQKLMKSRGAQPWRWF